MSKQHLLLNRVLDTCGEDTSLHVCTASGQQYSVWVPIDGKDGGPDGFLELRDPPVALLVEGTDYDGLITTGQRRPGVEKT